MQYTNLHTFSRLSKQHPFAGAILFGAKTVLVTGRSAPGRNSYRISHALLLYIHAVTQYECHMYSCAIRLVSGKLNITGKDNYMILNDELLTAMPSPEKL